MRLVVPVVILDYDPEWPKLFEKEKALILNAIGKKVVAMEHVGSTAVPGLGAKPVIDIAVAVNTLSDAEDCIEPLSRIGYEYRPEIEASIPDRRYFRKGPNIPNKHFHLHMSELSSNVWKNHLLFRDYLRENPEVAQQYCRLKKELAAKYGSDRVAYTDAKTSFIESVIARAKEADHAVT
jgi:GrpB-like predicted nucleotidyltransferase (UPF0157 family)